MAKKQEPPQRSRNQNKNSTKANTKTKNKAAKDDSSSDELQVIVVQSSSCESQNDDVLMSNDEEEEDVVEERSDSDEDEKEENEKPKSSVKKKGQIKEDVRSVGKKNKRKRQDEDEVEEEKSESALSRFPMNRISRIIRSEISGVRIAQEAVFLINRASEKFIELLSKEAYACAFVDHKKHIAYDHMSSVVSKRKRFDFLSDFVPEKVKAEDALAQIPEVEK